MSPKRVIIDLDAGTDDALALLVLLDADKNNLIKIEAICCSMGNTLVEHVCRNVIRLLELVDRTDIPVFRGADEQIIPPRHKIQLFHGDDGFGDLEYDTIPDLSLIKPEPAATGMYNTIAKYPDEVFLICLGPLTNVALAMKLYPNFASIIKEIYLMGGNYKAIGNVSKTAEYNFFVDPEAAHIVLNSAQCLINILTWETCLYSQIPFDWRFDVLGIKNNPIIQLLNKAERNIYKNITSMSWLPCDAFLTVAFVYPECVKEESRHHGTVELHGHDTRGQIVLDHLKQQEPNLRIIEAIDVEFFKNILLKVCS